MKEVVFLIDTSVSMNTLDREQEVITIIRQAAEKLQENFETLMGAVIKARPAAAKGQYIKSCVVASTMGPGIKVNAAKLG